jgi:hypothetical protein
MSYVTFNGDVIYGRMYKDIGYLNNYTVYKVAYNLYKYEL